MMVRAVPGRSVMGMTGVWTGPWLVFTSVGMSRMIASCDGEGCTPVRTVMGMPGVMTGPWLVFTSVWMSRMIASYDGEGCTCENSDGDAGCEDRSLARVHQCGDEQDDS